MKKLILFKIIMMLGSSAATAGGISSGGGNIAVGAPVAAAEIELGIRGVQSTLPLILNFYKNSFSDCKKNGMISLYEEALYNRLFSSPAIYQIINETSPTIKSEGSCYDSRGNEADASARMEKAIRSVCFRVSRLKRKLTSSNVAEELYALAAHEYAHFIGFTEEEAELLQTIILRNVNVKSVRRGPFVKTAMKGVLYRFEHGLTELYTHLNNTDFGKATYYLTYVLNIAEQFFALNLENLNLGFDTFRDQSSGYLTSVGIRTNNLIYFLVAEEDEFHLNFENYFKQESQLTLREFLIRMGAQMDEYPAGRISRIGVRDFSSIKREVEKIRELLIHLESLM